MTALFVTEPPFPLHHSLCGCVAPYDANCNWSDERERWFWSVIDTTLKCTSVFTCPNLANIPFLCFACFSTSLSASSLDYLIQCSSNYDDVLLSTLLLFLLWSWGESNSHTKFVKHCIKKKKKTCLKLVWLEITWIPAAFSGFIYRKQDNLMWIQTMIIHVSHTVIDTGKKNCKFPQAIPHSGVFLWPLNSPLELKTLVKITVCSYPQTCFISSFNNK